MELGKCPLCGGWDDAHAPGCHVQSALSDRAALPGASSGAVVPERQSWAPRDVQKPRQVGNRAQRRAARRGRQDVPLKRGRHRGHMTHDGSAAPPPRPLASHEPALATEPDQVHDGLLARIMLQGATLYAQNDRGMRTALRGNVSAPLQQLPYDELTAHGGTTPPGMQSAHVNEAVAAFVCEREGSVLLMIGHRQGFELSWDELRSVKAALGYGDRAAFELMPPDDQVIGQQDMRLLWLTSPGAPLPFGLGRMSQEAQNPRQGDQETHDE